MAYSALEAREKKDCVNIDLVGGIRVGSWVLTLNDGVHRAGLLAVATVDALGHIDIVTGRPAASILTLFRLNSDSLGRADSLAKLAGNAALLTGGITTQSVLSSETGGDGTLLEGVEDSVTITQRKDQLEDLRAIEG